MIDQYIHQTDLIINENATAAEAFRTSSTLIDKEKEYIRAVVDTTEKQGWVAEIE